MKGVLSSKKESGQATMEFVIMLPLLLAVIVLIVYGGWWGYARLSAQNFLYADCTGIARYHGLYGVSQRGYTSAFYTRPSWDVNTIYDVVLDTRRTGASKCTAILKNIAGQSTQGLNLTLVVESHGYMLFSPFMSCDDGYCK